MFFNRWKKLYHSLLDVLIQRDKRIEDLEKEVQDLKEANRQSVSVGHTLTRAAFNKFKSTLPNAMVGDDSSAGAIGHKLGVALVLQKMEQDLVVN